MLRQFGLEPGVAILQKWRQSPEDLAKFNLVIANIQQFYSQQNEASSSSSAGLAHVGQNFDLVLIDEAHHALATSWQRTINLFQPNSRIIFFTATSHPRGKGEKKMMTFVFQN